MRNIIAITLLVLIMGACTVGPNYTRPDVDAPSTWRIEEGEGKNLANTAWWEQFGDPVLNELITIALQENKDLMIASARVQEYAGRLTTTRSELFPQIGYDAEASRDRSSERLGRREAAGPQALPGQAQQRCHGDHRLDHDRTAVLDGHDDEHSGPGWHPSMF